jgi:hypothetical protein
MSYLPRLPGLCKARYEFGGAGECTLDANHKGRHWCSIEGTFYSKDDDRHQRDLESEEIKQKSITQHNKFLQRPEGEPCNCSAGICSKPEYTYGEGHYCDLPIFHEGEHHCRRCDKEFNSNSMPAYIYQHK